MSNDQYRFDYLKDKAANPMFKHMADFIKKQKCRKILDLGSGYSRINEFMGAYKYQLTAVDNDSHVIEYLNETYGEKENIDVVEADAISFVDSIGIDGIDCVVISGFLYYMKPYVFKYNPEDYIDKIVEKYNPKYILVCDPRPSIPYVSPDYEQLFSEYSFKIDAHDKNQTVLFPEMDEQNIEVPEITTKCWSVLRKDPSSIMCSNSRMVVHRKGEEKPKVVAKLSAKWCITLPMDCTPGSYRFPQESR